MRGTGRVQMCLYGVGGEKPLVFVRGVPASSPKQTRERRHPHLHKSTDMSTRLHSPANGMLPSVALHLCAYPICAFI